MNWDYDRVLAFDFETSGAQPEYALQPWRVATGKSWATSLVWATRHGDQTKIEGGLSPHVDMMRRMLEQALDEKRALLGWNVTFDIQWLQAYGLAKLVDQCRWLDGMLIWRHLDTEPEYDLDRSKKRSYSLKIAVPKFLPQYAGYEADIDFHDDTPEARARLHHYNILDTTFTLRIAGMLASQLTDRQWATVLIEAECLPLVAAANLKGMLIDTIAAQEVAAHMDQKATDLLAALTSHGVTEKVVRSPKQLATLLFDVWRLPVLKENKGKKTGLMSRSTNKEVLHELAFLDPRAKQLREYREALNLKTKFAEAPRIAAEYNGDGRARPQAIVFGTYSGRLTYASKQSGAKRVKDLMEADDV